MRKLIFTFFVASLALPLTAQSAPQILAVMAVWGEIPLSCADGVCQADLSTFCLQRARAMPAPGVRYRPAGSGALELVLTDAKGVTWRRPAAGLVTFVSWRGYTAVTARLPRARLAALGAVRAALTIAADVTLLPVPVAGDRTPLTAAEIAEATGPLRALGTRIVDRGGARAAAVRIVAGMVNGLPPAGRVDSARRAALWRGTAAREAGDSGLAGAKTVYAWCLREVTRAHRIFSMRRCLERRHDALMIDLNIDYWNNAGVGS